VTVDAESAAAPRTFSIRCGTASLLPTCVPPENLQSTFHFGTLEPRFPCIMMQPVWTILLLCSLPAWGAFDNSCLLGDESLTPRTKNAPQTFLRSCPGWVINTTDEVWNTRQDINASLEKYFYHDWSSTSSWGHKVSGMDTLKNLVASTLVAFPDLKIHITDVFCYGNDVDGYKTVMPDILVGTNLGPSAYGPATGKSVRYSGTAVCYVQKVKGRWVYVAEWLLHDEAALITQLGFTNLTAVPHPPLGNKLHDCSVNRPGFGWKPPTESSRAVTELEQDEKAVVMEPVAVHIPPVEPDDPAGKAVVKRMDELIADHVQWNNWTQWSALQRPYWTTDMTYDTVDSGVPGVLGNSTGLRQWYDSEHIPFNRAFKSCAFSQMIFVGDAATASTTTYGNALMQADFGAIKNTGKLMTIRICDFYRMEGNRIAYNWMMLDMVDLMLQAGYRVLPKAPLREQWVQPPNTMDGIPAPLSRVTTPEESRAARTFVAALVEKEWQRGDVSGSLWSEDMTYYGPVGFGVSKGVESYLTHFLKPLHAAFSHTQLQVDVLSCQGKFCGAHGYLYGNHTGNWLGEKATGKRVALRFGLHWHVDLDAGKALEGYAMFDLPAAFKQIGIDLYQRMDEMRKQGRPDYWATAPGKSS